MLLTPRGILCWPKEQRHPWLVVCWLIPPPSLSLENWMVLYAEVLESLWTGSGMLLGWALCMHFWTNTSLFVKVFQHSVEFSLGLLRILFSLSFKGNSYFCIWFWGKTPCWYGICRLLSVKRTWMSNNFIKEGLSQRWQMHRSWSSTVFLMQKLDKLYLLYFTWPTRGPSS